MKLEGTHKEVDIPEMKMSVCVKNTTLEEVGRLYSILQTCFDQGVFNTRNGSIKLHFDNTGRLKTIGVTADKWKEGKEVTHRVALYESVVVEVVG